VRFFLDNDVPVSVGTMLRRHGHLCWTANDAGLADEGEDDNLTVYAAKHQAVLVSLAAQFMRRRRANAIGRHVRLRCTEPEAAAVLGGHLKEALEYLERDHVTVTVSRDGVKADSDWA
jgi:predicted nuclease of predicted toxin-antitoxin system